MAKKVFIGSSKESYDDLRDVSAWMEELGFEALPWDEPSLFMPGENTLLKLIEIAKQVDAAIFIFGEDDKVWYRSDAMMQPRDNVLVEYGLFVSALGPKRAIICRKGKPKTATDLLGITFIDLDPAKKQGAKLRLSTWARNLGKQTDDPVVTQLTLQRDILRRERDEIADRLAFEEQKVRELGRLLKVRGVVDMWEYDFTKDGHWKLLFDYDYFWGSVHAIVAKYTSPKSWENALGKFGLGEVTHRIDWGHLTSASVAVAKTLRFLRFYEQRSEYQELLNQLDETIRARILELATERANRLKLEILKESD